MQEKADKINSEAEQIQSQATELQGKTLDIKKYMAIWRNLDESKKNTSGIKMDDINSLLGEFVTSLASVASPSKPVQSESNQADAGDSTVIAGATEASSKGTAKATKPSAKSSSK